VLSGEATNTIVFDLTRSGLESTIYHTRGEHVNHYTTDTVTRFVKLLEGLINSSYSRFKKSWHVDHDEKYDGGICRVSTIFVTGETKIIMWIIAFFLLITSIIKVVCVSIISINTFSIFVNKYLYSLKPLLLHRYIDTYKQTKIKRQRRKIREEKKTTTEKPHKHIHFNWRISGALILPKVKWSRTKFYNQVWGGPKRNTCIWK
jgi:hypothetical protein